ncbi:hypothetical protein TYRP_007398 [Tyrophagus putrescentiae]|nr:hypothetical protein TYRP_007398 [Tyrophagus putrescentiae]
MEGEEVKGVVSVVSQLCGGTVVAVIVAASTLLFISSFAFFSISFSIIFHSASRSSVVTSVSAASATSSAGPPVTAWGPPLHSLSRYSNQTFLLLTAESVQCMQLLVAEIVHILRTGVKLSISRLLESSLLLLPATPHMATRNTAHLLQHREKKPLVEKEEEEAEEEEEEIVAAAAAAPAPPPTALLPQEEENEGSAESQVTRPWRKRSYSKSVEEAK